MNYKYYDKNPFCTLFIDYYDLYMKRDLENLHTIKEEKEEEVPVKEEPKPDIIEEHKSGLFNGLFKKKDPYPTSGVVLISKVSKPSIEEIEFNSRLELLKKHKEELINESFTIEGISFSVLWDFIEFIEFAKITLFYEDNDSSFKSTIGMKENKEHRYINITISNKTSLLFDLYSVKDPNSKKSIDCIKISKIIGEEKISITVTDAQIDFEDESNVYLINTINYLLCEFCTVKINIIFDKLEKFFTDRTKRIYELYKE